MRDTTRTPEQSHLQISVRNFGPIAEGECTFKPLTIFIGPNNSGKSYMALLAYTLWKALAAARPGPFGRPYPPPGRRAQAGGADGIPELLRVFSDYYAGLVEKTVERTATKAFTGLAYADLPDLVQRFVATALDRELAVASFQVEEALRDSFAYDQPKALIRTGGAAAGCTVKVGNGSHAAFFSLRLAREEVSTERHIHEETLGRIAAAADPLVRRWIGQDDAYGYGGRRPNDREALLMLESLASLMK